MILTDHRHSTRRIILQENHKYHIRIFAKNEVGVSEPLETEEPYTIQKPMGKPHVFFIFDVFYFFFFGAYRSKRVLSGAASATSFLIS